MIEPGTRCAARGEFWQISAAQRSWAHCREALYDHARQAPIRVAGAREHLIGDAETSRRDRPRRARKNKIVRDASRRNAKPG